MATGIKGRVAVVTGGASGIGRATALAFAREGAKVVVVTARSMGPAEETVAQAKALGAEATFVQCDVSNESQVKAMVATAVAAFGGIDFAFNNAGVGPDGVTIPLAQLTEVAESDWDQVVDTNLKGVFLCLKHELRQMRMRGSGVIVNTSSTAGLRPVPGLGAYCPSKAGILSLTKLAAQENKAEGIRVNVVCPGPTKGTGMQDRLMSSMRTGGPQGEGLHGGAPPIMGVPDDVARVVIWLCSNEASHVNGNVISVDGGLDIL
jgi:NAD(P)-dependent dehydrogenase (short-subunit alcohol dehydrogenase family)